MECNIKAKQFTVGPLLISVSFTSKAIPAYFYVYSRSTDPFFLKFATKKVETV